MCHLMRRGVSTTSVFIMSLYLFFRRTILQKQELKPPERNRFFKLVLPDELDWPDDGQGVVEWVEFQKHSDETNSYHEKITPASGHVIVM